MCERISRYGRVEHSPLLLLMLLLLLLLLLLPPLYSHIIYAPMCIRRVYDPYNKPSSPKIYYAYASIRALALTSILFLCFRMPLYRQSILYLNINTITVCSPVGIVRIFLSRLLINWCYGQNVFFIGTNEAHNEQISGVSSNLMVLGKCSWQFYLSHRRQWCFVAKVHEIVRMMISINVKPNDDLLQPTARTQIYDGSLTICIEINKWQTCEFYHTLFALLRSWSDIVTLDHFKYMYSNIVFFHLFFFFVQSLNTGGQDK